MVDERAGDRDAAPADLGKPARAHAVERWRKHVEQALAAAVGRLVRQGVDAGELRDGIAARTPLLLVAPLTQACLRQALRAAPATRREVAASRRDYARFIEELLT